MWKNNPSCFVYRMQKPIFFVPWFLFIIVSYYYFDLPIATFFHHLSMPILTSTSTMLTQLGEGIYDIGILFFALIAAKFVFKDNNLSLIILFLLLCIIISGISCDVMKILLSRSRPDQFFDYQYYGFYFVQLKSLMWSFPSGHATTISSVMAGLSLIYTRQQKYFIALIFLVCLSRITVNAHFLSDVMAGMYLGIITASLIFSQFANLLNLIPRGLSWIKNDGKDLGEEA